MSTIFNHSMPRPAPEILAQPTVRAVLENIFVKGPAGVFDALFFVRYYLLNDLHYCYESLTQGRHAFVSPEASAGAFATEALAHRVVEFTNGNMGGSNTPDFIDAACEALKAAVVYQPRCQPAADICSDALYFLRQGKVFLALDRVARAVALRGKAYWNQTGDALAMHLSNINGASDDDDDGFDVDSPTFLHPIHTKEPAVATPTAVVKGVSAATKKRGPGRPRKNPAAAATVTVTTSAPKPPTTLPTVKTERKKRTHSAMIGNGAAATPTPTLALTLSTTAVPEEVTAAVTDKTISPTLLDLLVHAQCRTPSPSRGLCALPTAIPTATATVCGVKGGEGGEGGGEAVCTQQLVPMLLTPNVLSQLALLMNPAQVNVGGDVASTEGVPMCAAAPATVLPKITRPVSDCDMHHPVAKQARTASSPVVVTSFLPCPAKVDDNEFDDLYGDAVVAPAATSVEGVLHRHVRARAADLLDDEIDLDVSDDDEDHPVGVAPTSAPPAFVHNLPNPPSRGGGRRSNAVKTRGPRGPRLPNVPAALYKKLYEGFIGTFGGDSLRADLRSKVVAAWMTMCRCGSCIAGSEAGCSAPEGINILPEASTVNPACLTTQNLIGEYIALNGRVQRASTEVERMRAATVMAVAAAKGYEWTF